MRGNIKNHPVNVGIVMSSAPRYFLMALAKDLKDRLQCRIHVFCGTAQEIEFYNQANVNGLFDSVINGAAAYRTQSEQIPQSLIDDARRWEERIGCTFNTLAVADRHFGRGYALGGPGHPRSRMSEAWSYEQMLVSYINACEFWERQYRSLALDLIIDAPPIAVKIGRRHDVVCRTFSSSRYENLHYWGQDEYWANPLLLNEYRRLEGHEIDEISLTVPYFAERGFRRAFQSGISFTSLLRSLAGLTARHFYHRLRGYEKGKNYHLKSVLQHSIRRWRDSKVMSGPRLTKLRDLQATPYIFFPLHTEPESSVGMLSPEYFYQHAAIAALSRDLPSGVRLAVKETIHGVGRRPREFYAQVRDLKNVILLDMMELGVEVAKNALAVATITGTAGMEAAVMGKPVIAFGRHNLYGFLPHVFEIADEAHLKIHLSNIVNGRVDLKKARSDGARYLQAIKNTSFDMRGFDYLNLNKFDQASVNDATSALLESLGARVSATGDISNAASFARN